jgi:hypothetical protein
VKHLKIDYDAPLSGGGIEETHSAENPLQQKTFSMDGISGGGVLIQKNDIITVTATIDGKTESFEMRNQG